MYLLCLILSLVQVTTALQWTSAGSLPDNTTIPACPGQDVTLRWSYEPDADEHLNNVEWRYQPPGGSEVVLATQVMSSFFVAPGSTLHVESIPNAGIRLHNVAIADAGTYSVHVNLDVHGSIVREVQSVEIQVSDQSLTTDGQLHVKMLPQAVYDNSTQQYRVQLSCGDFLPVWSSKVAVLWKTPSNETLTSTSMDNGRFLLSVPNPVLSGEYTCVLDDTSPASLCVDSDSPLQRGATTNVDGVQAHFAVMGAQMTSLQQREGRVKQENADLRQQLETLTHQDTDLKQQLQTLTQNGDKLTQQLQTLKTEDADLKQQIETAKQDIANMQPKTENATDGVSFQAWRRGFGGRDALGGHFNFQELQQRFPNYHFPTYAHSAGDNVLFDHVTTNEGHAYDEDTGVFTVPTSGTYAFFVHIVTDGAVALEVDGSVLSSYHTTNANHFTAGNLQAIVPLTAGQKVSVVSLTDDTHVQYERSHHDVTFSGALLHAA